MPAGFEQRGEEAPRPAAWDAQLDVAPWDGQQAFTAAVAMAAPLSGAQVAIGTKDSSGLGLDQGLPPLAHQFRDQLAGGAAAKPSELHHLTARPQALCQLHRQYCFDQTNRKIK